MLPFFLLIHQTHYDYTTQQVDGCDKEAQYTHQRMCKRHWRELTCTGTMKRNNSRASAGVATLVTKQNTAGIDPKNTEEPSTTTRTLSDPIPSNILATMTTTTITEDNSQVSHRTSHATTTKVPIKEEEQEDADDYRQQQKQQQQQQQMGNQRTHGDEDGGNTDGRLGIDTKEFWSRPKKVKIENNDNNEEERLWTTFFQEEGDVDEDDNDNPEDKTVTTDATRNTATAVMPTILFHQEAITGGGEEIVF